MNTITKILLNAIPVLVMIGLIPWIHSDPVLCTAYAIIIVASFAIHHERNDGMIFLFGLIVMTASEYFFVSTGVETFIRNSLFGLMPIWLPLLWAYSFVAIKRGIRILEG